MKNNIRSWLIGLLIVGSVSPNFNLKVLISSVNPVSDAAAESVQGEETKLASSLPSPSTTQGEETPKAATPALSHPHAAMLPGVNRSITYEDLVGLRDIGVPEESDGTNGISLSPDAQYLAVETRQAILSKNVVEIRWLVIPLHSDEGPIDVGDGGEPIPALTPWGVNLGYSDPQLPQWSPDSQWIAYKAKDRNGVQVWRSRRDGTRQERLTTSTADVRTFRWTDNGAGITYETGPSRSKLWEHSERSAATGLLFSERYSPLYSTEPILDQTQPPLSERFFYVLDLGTRKERLATDAERRAHEATDTELEGKSRTLRASAEDLREDRAVGLNPALTIVARVGERERVRCEHQLCTGRFKGVWLDAPTKTVYFLRWANQFNYGRQALYSWKVGTPEPKEILATGDYLYGCSFVGRSLVCAHETSTHPAAIVSVDLETGAITNIYDPNPGFDSIRFGEVQELRWDSDSQVEGFGHLVKPIDYDPRKKYPLVIVQYRSRGFLRGGVGDEFPIHMLSKMGFAVLSFHRPDAWELQAQARTLEEATRRKWDDFLDRRRVLKALLSGIDIIAEQGLIDINHVGITGLSDGAETAEFALVQAPNRFAAAAVSQTFWSPISFYLANPMVQQLMRGYGFNDPNGVCSDSKWRQISVAANAGRIQTPLLIQAADAEMLPGAQSLTALREQKKPVEMIVFPNEHHIKSQPVHRYAVYRRSVQWFRFWLQSIEEENPVDGGQYERWRILQAQGKAIINQSPNVCAGPKT